MLAEVIYPSQYTKKGIQITERESARLSDTRRKSGKRRYRVTRRERLAERVGKHDHKAIDDLRWHFQGVQRQQRESLVRRRIRQKDNAAFE